MEKKKQSFSGSSPTQSPITSPVIERANLRSLGLSPNFQRRGSVPATTTELQLSLLNDKGTSSILNKEMAWTSLKVAGTDPFPIHSHTADILDGKYFEIRSQIVPISHLFERFGVCIWRHWWKRKYFQYFDYSQYRCATVTYCFLLHSAYPNILHTRTRVPTIICSPLLFIAVINDSYCICTHMHPTRAHVRTQLTYVFALQAV